MDQKTLFKQMLDFQKTTFDNSFNAMSTMQKQGEKMVDMFMKQATWLPADGKKVIKEWVGAYEKGRKEFKSTVDSYFDKVEDFFETSKE